MRAYLYSLGIIHLSNFPDRILYPGHSPYTMAMDKRFGEDVMSFRADAIWMAEEKAFSIKEYSARLIRVETIHHGTFDGIDTEELERRLSAIDWSIPLVELSKSHHGSEKAFDDLAHLTALPEASQTAMLLKLKYLAGTPAGFSIPTNPPPNTIDRSIVLPINRDINDINASQAYNLLCGRAVIQFSQNKQDWEPSHWVMHQNEKLVKLPLFELADRLRQIPFSRPLNDYYGMSLVEQLVNGDKPEVMLLINGKETRAFLQADPVAGNIAVSGSHMKAIYPRQSKQSPAKNKGKGSAL